MIVRYSVRAESDIDSIAAYYFETAGPRVVVAIEARLADVIEHLAINPLSAPRVSRRSKIRSTAVVKYPFRIFYRVHTDAIEILHVRHTSRRPTRLGG